MLQQKPPEKPKDGRLAGAFVLGGVTFLGVFLASERILTPYGVPDVVAGILGLVAGGFVSGMILEPDLRERQWRFLWLSVASPATLLWAYAILVVICDRKAGGPGLLSFLSLCIPAVAGSVLGYNASRAKGHRSRGRSQSSAESLTGPDLSETEKG